MNRRIENILNAKDVMIKQLNQQLRDKEREVAELKLTVDTLQIENENLRNTIHNNLQFGMDEQQDLTEDYDVCFKGFTAEEWQEYSSVLKSCNEARKAAIKKGDVL